MLFCEQHRRTWRKITPSAPYESQTYNLLALGALAAVLFLCCEYVCVI